MVNKIGESKIPPDRVMTPEEVQVTMSQLEKDAKLSSLLYVTRKLGEVEGMISAQDVPDKALVTIQKDLKQVYNKLVEDADIELLPETQREGIGGDES
ncbi:MAG: hypothetical protein HQ556_01785 [Candidatus Marinimicrobia bacterium]|nr:hypothetical protein [Candidatus Neomarinimicrobiota bacterium]